MFKTFQHLITLNPSAPLTSGGNDQLAEGQIGLFRNGGATINGAPAVSDITAIKNAEYFIEVGTDVAGSDAGMSVRNLRTPYFKAKDILDIKFTEADDPVQSKVYLGYDGLDPSKSISLGYGESAQISLKLNSHLFGAFGYNMNGDEFWEGKFTLSQPFEEECVDSCTTPDCREKITDLIQVMKSTIVQGKVPLSEFVNIKPIYSCAETLVGESDVVYFSLEVKDQGDVAAKGLVQAQYPSLKVERTDREGILSTYTVAVRDGSTPSAFTEWSKNIKTDCGADCPDGYTKSAAGFLYNISLEDEGVDESSDIDAITLTSGADLTATKVGQVYGVGTYTILSDIELTQADWDEIIADGTIQGDTLARDGEVQEVEGVCVKDSDATIAWVEGETCNTYLETYSIYLDDTKCGNSRLAELKAAYPENDVYIVGAVSGVETPISGTFTNGTYNDITTFTTDGDGTGAQFDVVVTGGNSAAITIDDGGSGFKVGDSITIPDSELGNGGEDDLVFEVTAVTNENKSTCRQKYFIDVVTDVVCDDCHKDLVVSEPPSRFGFVDWVRDSATAGEDCKCGIEFEARYRNLCQDKFQYDREGIINDQIQIEVSGGERINTPMGYRENDNPFAVSHITQAYNGSNWGYDLWEKEKETFSFLLGFDAGNSYPERRYKGTTPRLEPCEQYDIISLKLQNTKQAAAQGMNSTFPEVFWFSFSIPRGSKADFASFFNSVTAGNPDAGTI